MMSDIESILLTKVGFNYVRGVSNNEAVVRDYVNYEFISVKEDF